MKDSLISVNQTARLIVQLVQEFGLSLSHAATIAMVPLEFAEMIMRQSSPKFA